MSEEQLRAEFAAASKKIGDALVMAKGGAKAEARYGEAYQALVSAGLEPQLRRKYRY